MRSWGGNMVISSSWPWRVLFPSSVPLSFGDTGLEVLIACPLSPRPCNRSLSMPTSTAEQQDVGGVTNLLHFPPHLHLRYLLPWNVSAWIVLKLQLKTSASKGRKGIEIDTVKSFIEPGESSYHHSNISNDDVSRQREPEYNKLP